MTRIALNGLGRIGKLVLRDLIDSGIAADIVLLNDAAGDPEQHPLLLEFDSVHGRWPVAISHHAGGLTINGRAIRMTQARAIDALPLAELGIDMVIDCTGAFKTEAALAPYFAAGVKRVLVSAPVKDGGALNINDDTRMVVTAQGNAGVGTMTPVQRLHLLDREKVALRLETGEDGSWDILADGGAKKLRINYGGQAMLNVNKSGQVSIGTEDTPPSLDGGTTNIGAYRLYVEGGILTKEVRVRELWADYVFAPEYHLLSLPQVEAFIAENGHLPNTPSARDVEAQGINLGAATANQQEKIEELYLHLIELNKRLEKLEAENAALKAQQQH